MSKPTSRWTVFGSSLAATVSIAGMLVLASNASAQSVRMKWAPWDSLLDHSESTAAGSDADTAAAPGLAPAQPSITRVIAPPVNAARVSCKNDPGDADRIQNAIASNSAVALSGTCMLGAKTLTLGSHFFLGGSATLNYAGSGFAVTSEGSNNTISGLTFNGGGVELSLNDRTNWTGQYGWIIQTNTFENITNGTSAIHVSNIIGKGAESLISYNTFTNIWPGGYPSFPTGYSAGNCGGDCLLGNGSGGSGIWIEMGMDRVSINNNHFDALGGNAIKGFWDGFVGHIHPYEGHQVEISHNVMTRIHRIGIEVQVAGRGACPGGCNYSLIPTDGTVIKDNLYYNPAFAADPFGFSLMVGGTNVQIINNSAVDEAATCYWPLGIALENTMNGGLLQGNVMSSTYQSCAGGYNKRHGWAGIIVSGYTSAGYTDNFYNNFACGDGVISSALVTDDPLNSATMNERADFGSTTCPKAMAASNISIQFASGNNRIFAGEATGTFNIALTSTLSIQFVQFFLDNSRNPAATQEVQDFNPHFSTNPQWLYHATVDLSGLPDGAHKITVVATDVAGGTQAISREFATRHRESTER